MTNTILVSGASGIIGYGILKSLRQSHPDCRLIGITVYERSPAQAFCDIFEKALPTSHPGYFDWIVGLIKKYDISLAIPGIEIDVSIWNEHREIFEKNGAKVLLNNAELIRLCSDKWSFYQRLVECRALCAIPSSLEYNPMYHRFPFLLKPRRGSGSKGIVMVDNQEVLEIHLKDIGDELMIQPIVGTADEEYTTSAFFDGKGKLCNSFTLKRTLAQGGFTESAETVVVANIDDEIVRLGGIFKPIGPTNFQFRMDHGKPWLLEINPRISSANSIRTAFGYNESAMAMNFFIHDIIPNKPLLRRGFAVRYVEDIIYYDRSDL